MVFSIQVKYFYFFSNFPLFFSFFYTEPNNEICAGRCCNKSYKFATKFKKVGAKSDRKARRYNKSEMVRSASKFC